VKYTNETEAIADVAPIQSEPVETASVKSVEATPSAAPIKPKAENSSANKRIKATNQAASKDQELAGSYRVTMNLNMRNGAGMSEKIMIVIPKNTTVRNYGFYTEANDDKWLYVQVVQNNIVYSGFCSSKYLDKI
jgi:hypothetical protein